MVASSIPEATPPPAPSLGSARLGLRVLPDSCYPIQRVKYERSPAVVAQQRPRRQEILKEYRNGLTFRYSTPSQPLPNWLQSKLLQQIHRDLSRINPRAVQLPVRRLMELLRNGTISGLYSGWRLEPSDSSSAGLRWQLEGGASQSPACWEYGSLITRLSCGSSGPVSPSQSSDRTCGIPS